MEYKSSMPRFVFHIILHKSQFTIYSLEPYKISKVLNIIIIIIINHIAYNDCWNIKLKLKKWDKWYIF